jgi:two-component system, cell cycle sensor histidine kinase and response regulator CckA
MHPAGLAEPERLAEDRYRTLVHHSVDVIAVLDKQGIRRYLSPGVYAMLGFRADELIGRDAFDLIHPDDLGQAREAFAEVLSADGAVARAEMRARRADGTYVDCEIMGCNQVTNPVVGGIILNIRDVSERKKVEAERLSLQRQLAEARKQESVGVLAGGMAHELNNLMTAVLGYASLAGMQAVKSSLLASYLGAIEQAAIRSAELCRKLLAYAGGGAVATRPVDLSALVRGAARPMRDAVSAGADLRLDLADSLPLIDADPDQMRQVLMNLLHNAAEALPGGAGAVRVGTSVIEADEGHFHGMGGYEYPIPGRYVVLAVEDGGCGMDASTRERAFDPFFSTKFVGRGLGLAAVLGIVRSHRGVIEVRSEPGHGSTFRVYFPALMAFR